MDADGDRLTLEIERLDGRLDEIRDVIESSRMAPIDLAKDLQAPFSADDIEWRIGRSGVKDGRVWATALCYLTNRAIMKRLDDVFGPGGWANKYTDGPGGGTLCGITAWIDGREVTKWDGAQAPDTEPVKGVLSDSMKRAAVQWGIGRYLYRLEEVFVDTTPDKQRGWHYASHKDRDGKKTVYYWRTPSPEESGLPLPGGQPEAEKAEREGDGGRHHRDADSDQKQIPEAMYKALLKMADGEKRILDEVKLTDWERDFLPDILTKFRQYGKNVFVSPAQDAALVKIWDKVNLHFKAVVDKQRTGTGDDQPGMQGAARAVGDD